MEAILFLSDLHIGKPDFNMENAMERTQQFIKEVQRKCMGAGSVSVVLGGDIVDGENIYPRQAWDVSHTVNEQMAVAYQVLSDIFDILYSHYGHRMRMFSVEGNHGRASKHSYGNWDTALAQMLAVDLSHRNIEYEFVGYRQPLFFEVEDMVFMALHGDGIPMYMNIPFYGIYRRVMSWSNTMDFDAVLLGHFHSLNYSLIAGKHVFLNGTWHYDDEFAFSKGLIPSLNQWCIYVDGRDISGMVPLSTKPREEVNKA